LVMNFIYSHQLQLSGLEYLDFCNKKSAFIRGQRSVSSAIQDPKVSS